MAKDALVVRSGIRKAVPANMSVSRDVAEALDERVRMMLQHAAERAKGNNRQTVMARDL